MRIKLTQILEKIMPFLVVGIVLVLFIVALVLLSYLLFWGALIGLVLFGISYIKNKFFPKKKWSEKKGRVIEHDDS